MLLQQSSLRDSDAQHQMREKETLPLDNQFEIRINWFLAADHNHLFNEVEFFRLHTNSCNDVYAQLTRISDQKVFATIAFYERGDNVFSSPNRGTFGGLSASASLDIEYAERFTAAVTAHLRGLGARELRVKLAPLSHDLPLLSMFSNILYRDNWSLCGNELNFDMRVDATPLIERVEYGNAKKIRKCQRDGYQARRLDLDQLELAYRLIAENRKRRGFPMTMTYPQVATMAALFPQRLFVFGVHRAESPDELLAGAICLAIKPDILYVLYWGDASGTESHSPVTLLASAIYQFCQQERFAMLDIGISTVDGIPNVGLANFKRRLGFSPSMKLAFSRTLT